MVLGIQIAGTLFGIVMMYYTFLKYKKKVLSVQEHMFWMIGWIGFIIISLFPSALDFLVETGNFARTFDLLVVGGFIFLIGLSFYTYTIVKKNRKDVEDIVRKLAIEKKK